MSMEELQSWLSNGHFLSNSPSSLSSSATTYSHETQTTPTLCEDISSNSVLESNDSPQTTPSYTSQNNYTISKPSFSCIASVNTLSSRISCLAIHNNTLYAASINEINVFDLSSPYALIDSFGSGFGWVKSIAFCENRIFTAHQDCKIRVWKLVTNLASRKLKHQFISTIPTLKDRLSNCLLAKNYVQVRRHKQKLWIEHTDAVSGLAVNNDIGLMYSVSWDKYFKIWKMSSNMQCMESVKAHSDAVNAIVVNSVDGTVYTGSADGNIKVWKMCNDSKKHKLLTTLEKHESSVNALALSSDGKLLYSGGGDRNILAWERGHVENHVLVAFSLKGHRGAILCMVYLNNGVLISGSSDNTLRIWKHGNDFGFCCLASLQGHVKPVKSLVAVRDEGLDEGFSVFSGSLDGEIRVWKVTISDDRD